MSSKSSPNKLRQKSQEKNTFKIEKPKKIATQ